MGLLDRFFKKKVGPVKNSNYSAPGSLVEMFEWLELALTKNELYVFTSSVCDCSRLSNLLTPDHLAFSSCKLRFETDYYHVDFDICVPLWQTIAVDYNYNCAFDGEAFTSNHIMWTMTKNEIYLLKSLIIKIEDCFGYAVPMELWSMLDQWEEHYEAT